nr:hypothetical protein [Kitasatospora sp. SID7827]
MPQAEHDESAARADHLREQIDQLTSAPAEVEARLAGMVTSGKVIDGLGLLDNEPATAETAPVHQRIVTAFNEDPRQVFRVGEVHELLDQPGRSRYWKRT